MNTWRNRAGRIFERKLRGKADIKAELLEDDRQAMLPLPPKSLRSAARGALPSEFAVAGPLRPQRLLGADPIRPSGGDGDRRHRKGAVSWCGTT